MHKQHVVNYTVAKLNHPLSQYIPPISRIPVELLSEIFLFSCALQTRYGCEVHDLSPFDKRASPMNLTHVNGHWRHVAISHPRLWTDIYIFHMFPRSPNSLKLWLERSRNLPLHIAFETRRYCWSSRSPDTCSCDVPCPLHEAPRTNEVLSLMVDHSSRWEEIDFNICIDRPTPLLSLNHTDIHSLKSACFHDRSPEFSDSGPVELDYINKHRDTFWNVAAASSLLQEVSICGNLPLYLHWNRLKYLSIHSSLDLSMLSDCSQLEHLILGRPCPPIDSSRRILLPTLKHLEILGPSGEPGLDSFTLPSLESLSLFLFSPAPDSSFHDLEQFMHRSSPPLKSLTIQSNCWWGEVPSSKLGIEDPSNLLSLLSSNLMTTLISLTMKGCPSPPHLIHLLSSQSQNPLPSLEEISIEYPATILIEDIARMVSVRNRRQSIVPLRSFQAVLPLHYWARDDPQKRPYMFPDTGEMEYEGCKIIIRSFDETTYLDV